MDSIVMILKKIDKVIEALVDKVCSLDKRLRALEGRK
jgi:hypothetical protein